MSKRIDLLDSFYRLLAKNESDPNLKTLLTLPHAIQLIEFSMFEPALLSFILFLVFSSLTVCRFFSLFFNCRVRGSRFELDPFASPRSFRTSRHLHHAIRERSLRSAPHLPNLPPAQLDGLPFLRRHRFFAPPRDAPRHLEPSLHSFQSKTRQSASRSQRVRPRQRGLERVCGVQRGELAAKQLRAVAAIVGAVDRRVRRGVDAALRRNGESGAEGDDGSGGSERAAESIEEIDREGEEEREQERRGRKRKGKKRRKMDT